MIIKVNKKSICTSFTEHTLGVTNIVAGFGCNAIIVLASEDRTCKIWSLSRGTLLSNVVFPTIIDAIAMDPGEHVLFAGGRDGNIYVAALNTSNTCSSKYGLHILSHFSNHTKAVTCLVYGISGSYLISGSEDGVVRVWDAKTSNIIRVLKHAKGYSGAAAFRAPAPGEDFSTSSSGGPPKSSATARHEQLRGHGVGERGEVGPTGEQHEQGSAAITAVVGDRSLTSSGAAARARCAAGPVNNILVVRQQIRKSPPGGKVQHYHLHWKSVHMRQIKTQAIWWSLVFRILAVNLQFQSIPLLMSWSVTSENFSNKVLHQLK